MTRADLRLRACVLGISLSMAAVCVAQEDVDRQFKVFQRDHLFGDWNGLRTLWAENGFTFDVGYTSQYFYNADGGLDEGGDYRGDLSLTLEVDTATAGWWENGEFFVHIQQQHGDLITEEHVGDFQGLSNMDADNFFQVSEIWYKHYFVDGKLWLKLGKMEGNEDFAFVEYGGEFLNSSPGFSPTIPLVTFPEQDWGVVFGAAPVDWFSINLGVYSGRNHGSRSIGSTMHDLHGPFAIVEPAFHYDLGGRAGHIRFGYWYHGDDFEWLDGLGVDDSTDGFYATWDQQVYAENPDDEEDEQGIGVFGQYGHSDERVIEVENYYGGGVQWIGAIPSRDDDVLGLGVFHVDFSDDGGFAEDSETAYELFYKIQVCPWISVKPEVQYIVNPGGMKNSDATVYGARAEISF